MKRTGFKWVDTCANCKHCIAEDHPIVGDIYFCELFDAGVNENMVCDSFEDKHKIYIKDN